LPEVFLFSLCRRYHENCLFVSVIPGIRTHGTFLNTTTIARMCQRIDTIPSIDTMSDFLIVSGIVSVIQTMIQGMRLKTKFLYLKASVAKSFEDNYRAFFSLKIIGGTLMSPEPQEFWEAGYQNCRGNAGLLSL
jgi:hypothetical protein